MLQKTKHLTLRDFTLDDLDAFARLVADAEFMRFSLKGPLSREEARKYLQSRILDHYEKYGFGLWAIVHNEDRRIIGFAGFITQVIDGEEFVELAYRLDPVYWGQGLAFEAAKAIIEYGFSKLNLGQIISIIDPKNTRSIALAKRLGMHLGKEALFHGIPVQIYALKKVLISGSAP